MSDETPMTSPHPLLILASVVGPKPVAEALGQALERVLDTPEGEAKFVAFLERAAAERRESET